METGVDRSLMQERHNAFCRQTGHGGRQGNKETRTPEDMEAGEPVKLAACLRGSILDFAVCNPAGVTGETGDRETREQGPRGSGLQSIGGMARFRRLSSSSGDREAGTHGAQLTCLPVVGFGGEGKVNG